MQHHHPKNKSILTDSTPIHARDWQEKQMTDTKINPRHNIREIYPDTGTELTAKSWMTEAPLRMLMNNLHPDVAENPHELVVYGGIGRGGANMERF
jgi:hypothetical protein